MLTERLSVLLPLMSASPTGRKAIGSQSALSKVLVSQLRSSRTLSALKAAERKIAEPAL